MSEIDQDLAVAFQKHQEGQLEEARAIYLGILKRDSGNLNALHLLGMLAHQSGQHDESIACFRLALATDLREPMIHYNFALALETARRFEEAEAQYRSALELDPSFVQASNNLANLLVRKGMLREAEAEYRNVIQMRPTEVGYHANLGRVLQQQGRYAEALVAYREALRLEPKDDAIRYIIAALSGEERPSSPPASYVAGVFNEYAERYDKHMTQTLGYQVPTLLREHVKRLRPAGDLEILDAGCGTGLSGEMFRDLARTLTGVDLAAKMLDKARERGIYDGLFECDLIEFLRGSKQRFDLVVATDVLIYLGDAAPLFEGAWEVLRPGGLLALSVEDFEGQDFQLETSGRYSHAGSYLRRLAQQTQFTELATEAVVVRTEHNRPLPGHLFVFSR